MATSVAEFAMKVTATEAKNRLGQVLEQAQAGPVFIEKAGRRHAVVISNERYEELLQATRAGGGALGERRRRFNALYGDWIAEQNERFARNGPWNEEFRRW
jgi:prevent-host-death family protein